MSAPDPLRVCLAVGTLNVGGAETQVVGVARRLRAAGVDVEVLLLNSRGPLQAVLDEAGVPSYCAGYPGIRFMNDTRGLRPWLAVTDVRRLFRLALHVRRRRFDVLHAYLFHAYAVFVPLAFVLRVPVRIAARRGLHSGLPRSPVLRPLTWLSTRLATAVVANADAVAEDAHLEEGVPREKLRVIPNAVDLPDEPADPAVSPPVGMIIANLIHYKGHLDLVEAVARLDTPPVIRCVGEGPMREQVEAAIRERGLQDRVLLEGHRMGGRALYRQAQFALLTSHVEGMPNAVLEAMAAGLPVVATDVGGCRELVEDGVTGLLVPPRDPDALAHALRRVTSDPGWRVEAGRAARQRAARFSWQACAAQHLSCYRELLDRTARARSSPRR
jgi:glycosyltransferase involved in cell wall biosynthesis